jgi:hypothetical protein
VEAVFAKIVPVLINHCGGFNMAESSDVQSIMRRLERVERENRRLKSLSLVIAIIVGAVLVMAQAPSHRTPRTIEAEQFILKDASGKVRADLSMADNTPVLALLSDKGSPLVNLQGSDSPALTLSNADSKELLKLLASPDVNSLALYDGQTARVGVGVWKGDAGFALYDDTGKLLWSAH